MIDPITSLAISMQTKKGTFALLLGSGVSRSAQIPTGWDIVRSLIERLAIAEGKALDKDPEQWYREKYNTEPDYGDILDRLPGSPAERGQLIRSFIEPNENERDIGLKQPTVAHRAIASLVANGYIRVIITTNFDRLLESALDDMGVVPSVIDSIDAVEGTLPFAHNSCTILKVHGDYVDARIRNTTDELASYPVELNAVLDQALREYGLVVCGWSAEWDTALTEALLRTKSPWFSTYWISFREPGDRASAIVASRQAQMITNMDADTFFERLADSVESLEDLRSPELLSLKIAEQSLKRFIDDPTKRTRVHDLVVGEASRVRRIIDDTDEDAYLKEINQGEIAVRLKGYEDATATLRALFTTGCYWGNSDHNQVWVSALERLSSFTPVQGRHYDDWTKLRLYPALITLYAGGVAAVAREQYDTLFTLLYKPTSTDVDRNERHPIIFSVHCWIMSEAFAQRLAPGTIPGAVLPHRVRFQEDLWITLKDYVPAEDRFHEYFDLFEYFAGLVHTDLAFQLGSSPWGPRGYLPYRNYGVGSGKLTASIQNEMQVYQDEWPPLTSGMFGGSLERLNRAKIEFDRRLERGSYG